MKLRNKTFGWLVAAFIVAGSTGIVYSLPSNETGRYLTAPVDQGEIAETVTAVGNIQPRSYVDVGTQVTGQLKALHVNLGQRVKAGELVAEIDPTLFLTRVEATRATLRNLEAQLADRRAQRNLARQQHQRNKELFKINAVSREALEQSAAAVEQTAAQVAALHAQIQQTQSTLHGDEASLRYTKIFAPIDGTIVSINARQGQTLVASQQAPTILRIAELSTMTVWAQASEADVPKIKVGMPVYFNTLGEPERRWTGKVTQILPTPEVVNNVVLYNVLFDVENPDQALKTQMSAQVYFLIDHADSALRVPVAALQPAQAGGKAGGPAGTRRHTVQVLTDAGVEVRPVSVGIRNRTQAQVVSGLTAGERVVVGVAGGKEDQKRSLPRAG